MTLLKDILGSGSLIVKQIVMQKLQVCMPGPAGNIVAGGVKKAYSTLLKVHLGKDLNSCSTKATQWS